MLPQSGWRRKRLVSSPSDVSGACSVTAIA
jgi:hypothetical protein